MKNKIRIGLVGHFRYRNGNIPDGVARWTESIFNYLLNKDYNVEGYAFCGDSRNNEKEKVNFYTDKEIAKRIEETNLDIAIIRGSAKVSNELLDSCIKKGIKSIFVMPYWGLWQGTFDLAKKSDILITGTKDYAEELRNYTKRDCRYIPWPIETNFWTPGNSQFIENLTKKDIKNKFKIIYAGRLGKTKKVHRFIEPFKKHFLDKNKKDFLFIICGQAENEDTKFAIENEIKKNNLEEQVLPIFRGFTMEEMREIYRSTDVFIFPSSGDTYGQSHLESISCGIPAVVPVGKDWTDNAVPSMANLPNYLFGFKAGKIWDEIGRKIEDPSHDWEEACQKIEWIYNNRKESKIIIEEYQKIIKRDMSLEIIGKSIEKTIEDVYNK